MLTPSDVLGQIEPEPLISIFDIKGEDCSLKGTNYTNGTFVMLLAYMIILLNSNSNSKFCKTP